jgi:tryptophan synthase alpha chain
VSRLDIAFQERIQGRSGVLVPYFTAGLPDTETVVDLVLRADRTGAAVVEIGFPYSDSIADGPVIQQSFYDALARGHRVDDAFALARQVRDKISCGLVAMVSYSLVYRFGSEAFFGQAAAAGYDGVILPDVPVEEADRLHEEVLSAGLCHIGLVAPTTSPARRERIAATSTGFVYQIAAAGTTGERTSLSEDLPALIDSVKAAASVPVCVGFGISTADHVRAVCQHADGAIVGSALVRQVRQALEEGCDRTEIVDRVGVLLDELMTGTLPAP